MKKNITLYGIPNCDTVKKARAWLAAKADAQSGHQGLEVAFHDFKKQGVPEDHLDAWIAAVGWEKLVNRQGTTWRKLDDATKALVVDAKSAKALMLAQPSVIKRPVVEWNAKETTVGFSETEWEKRL